MNHQQRDDGGEERQRVQSEAPLLAELRQGLPGQRRSDRHRQVELNRIQRDGVGHVFAIDQGGDQRGIGRAAESLRKSRHERQAEDVPDMYQTGGHQECQDRGAGHLNVLRGQQHFAPLDRSATTPPIREKRKIGMPPRN